MKVFPQKELELSVTSKFTKLLIAFNFLPIYVNEQLSDAKFAWISLRTLLFILVSYSPSFLVGVLWLSQIDFIIEYLEVWNEFNKKERFRSIKSSSRFWWCMYRVSTKKVQFSPPDSKAKVNFFCGHPVYPTILIYG